MGKDIHIEDAEGVHLEGNRTASGRPVEVEANNSSGVIRHQNTNLVLGDGSDFDVVDSDINHLVVDESIVQLYDVLVKGLTLTGNGGESPRIPQYFDSGKTFDTRPNTPAETAMDVAVSAGNLIDYLSRLQFIYWLAEKGFL